MKFIDEAVIHVQAGKGGAGSRHFRREKFVPLGGPDGGNGGRGGSVILRADANIHTLLDFKFQAEWKAEDGSAGGGSQKDGKAGEDIIIKLPVGTQIFVSDPNSQEVKDLVVDLDVVGREFVLAKGGRGGKGNAFFKTATNQAPEYAQPGEEGEEGTYLLSLKLVADVGLVGFPNAGKSTLISRISAAKPKIADYPFTTLVPNLGVVQAKGRRTFVVADIPGLIPGASEGKGLGIRFLKHVERTKVIAHLLDLTQLEESGEEADLEKLFDSINYELGNFSEELAHREQIVVLTKADAVSSQERVDHYRELFQKRGYQVVVISSVAGKGILELVELLAEKVEMGRNQENQASSSSELIPEE
jgi:GTP-binding protein